jgi:hypothetical protein
LRKFKTGTSRSITSATLLTSCSIVPSTRYQQMKQFVLITLFFPICSIRFCEDQFSDFFGNKKLSSNGGILCMRPPQRGAGLGNIAQGIQSALVLASLSRRVLHICDEGLLSRHFVPNRGQASFLKFSCPPECQKTSPRNFSTGRPLQSIMQIGNVLHLPCDRSWYAHHIEWLQVLMMPKNVTVQFSCQRSFLFELGQRSMRQLSSSNADEGNNNDPNSGGSSSARTTSKSSVILRESSEAMSRLHSELGLGADPYALFRSCAWRYIYPKPSAALRNLACAALRAKGVRVQNQTTLFRDKSNRSNGSLGVSSPQGKRRRFFFDVSIHLRSDHVFGSRGKGPRGSDDSSQHPLSHLDVAIDCAAASATTGTSVFGAAQTQSQSRSQSQQQQQQQQLWYLSAYERANAPLVRARVPSSARILLTDPPQAATDLAVLRHFKMHKEDTRREVRRALVDLLLLGQSRVLIGTWGSTFTTLAADMAGPRTVLVRVKTYMPQSCWHEAADAAKTQTASSYLLTDCNGIDDGWPGEGQRWRRHGAAFGDRPNKASQPGLSGASLRRACSASVYSASKVAAVVRKQEGYRWPRYLRCSDRPGTGS